MARSPNYNPATHGTGWASNQPSNAIVAYLNNPVVTNEQRLQLWEQEGVTPPSNLIDPSTLTQPAPTATTTTSSSTSRSRTSSTPYQRNKPVKKRNKPVNKFIINWAWRLPEDILTKVVATPLISLTPSEPATTTPVATIQPAQITTTTTPNITNPIVENFQQLPPDNITGLFGIIDG
jgi:hypothetical protein